MTLIFDKDKGLNTPNTAASFLSVNSKSSKKTMADRVVHGAMTRSAMLSFKVLHFTNKRKGATVFGVSNP